MNIVAHEPNLTALVRKLYSRHPEYWHHEPWELQHVLYSLGYTDGLVEEPAISAAIEVARTDWAPNEGAA